MLTACLIVAGASTLYSLVERWIDRRRNRALQQAQRDADRLRKVQDDREIAAAWANRKRDWSNQPCG